LLVGLLVSAAPPALPIPSAEPTAIIVTGERVGRPVRETTSSVAVFDRRNIDSAGAHRVDQMLALIPNVQLGNGSQGPAIRGLDTTGPLQALPAFLGGNRPRTTIVVDGRAVTYNEFVFGPAPLWDVERVEVYRSPQTTTQGVNSIAGAAGSGHGFKFINGRRGRRERAGERDYALPIKASACDHVGAASAGAAPCLCRDGAGERRRGDSRDRVQGAVPRSEFRHPE